MIWEPGHGLSENALSQAGADYLRIRAAISQSIICSLSLSLCFLCSLTEILEAIGFLVKLAIELAVFIHVYTLNVEFIYTVLTHTHFI